MTKRFKQINLPSNIIDIKTSKIYHTTNGNDGYELCILLNTLHELADGNENQLLEVMSYLHDNYYEIWEEVNKELIMND